MEVLGTLMIVYEIISGVGGVLQVALLLLRRTNNVLMALRLILDAIGLSGMFCGHTISGELLFAIADVVTITLDVAFVLYILYREEHPKVGAVKNGTVLDSRTAAPNWAAVFTNTVVVSFT